MNRKVSVGFTGGHGSGKTTLAKYVIEKYGYENTYVNQTRKELIDRYDGKLDEARSHNIEFQWNLILKKTMWEQEHYIDGFVTDRTTLDNYAYYLAYSNPYEVYAKDLLKYEQLALAHASRYYDVIFCLAPIYDTPYDPLSPNMILEKAKIHKIVLGLITYLEGSHSNIVYVDVLELAERMRGIDDILVPLLKE